MTTNIKYKRKIDKIIKNVKEDINLVTSGDSKYPIYKYEKDKLKYIKRVLNNGLEILFIEDDLAVQSEVYMNVKVGHNHNPVEYPGLAHFLEHMLFIGSEKYPTSCYYNKLIADNDGHSNAYTATDHTLYYFGCRSDLLFNIIDVFCNFFISPLFDPEYVEKEITAVDYEHQKNVSSDFARRFSLIDIFVKDEVNSKFGTGDKSTLHRKGIIEALKKFYKKYYTIDRMMLIVVHNNINENFISGIGNIFSQISNRKSDIDINEIYPVAIDMAKYNGYEIIKAEKLEEGSDMMIRFFLPDTIKNRKVIDRSYHILSYILNHGGDQSLYTYLSKLNIVKSIYAGIGNIYTGDIGYDIIVDLTDHGLSIYNQVILIILGYINRIRSVNNIFDTYQKESRDIDILNINTMGRIPGASAADNVIDIHNSFGIDNQYVRIHGMMEDVPTMKKHFNYMLDDMLNNVSLRMKVILMSNTFNSNNLDKIDKYYGTKYSIGINKLDPELITKFFNIQYIMPELNSYIPSKLNVIVPIKENLQSQKNIVIDSKVKLDDLEKIDDPNEFIRLNSQKGNYYHLLKSNNYGTYYAYGKFKILLSSLKDKLNPIDVIIIELYSRLVVEAHKSDLYLSSTAGNNIVISITKRAINLQFKAFDNKLEILLTEFMKWFYHDKMEIDYDTYQRIYTTMKENLLAHEKSEPYTRLHSTFVDSIDPENNISNSQFLYVMQLFEPILMKENNKINFNNLQKRAIKLINEGSVRGVMAGSIKLKTAQKVVNIIDSYYKYSKNYEIRYIKNSVLNCDKNYDPDYKSYSSKTNNGDELVYIDRLFTTCNKNEQDKNTGLLYAIHLGEYVRSEYDYSDKKTTHHLRDPLTYLIPENAISQHFFNIMRTENQFGYYVKAGISGVTNDGAINLFLNFEIQTQEPDILNILRKYVDTELLDIVLNLDEAQVQKTIDTYIKNTFKEYSTMSSKLSDAYSIQAGLTYDDLDKIGTKIHLNRLRSIDAYRELKKINASQVHDLYKRAILNNPRYVVLITPNQKSISMSVPSYFE